MSVKHTIKELDAGQLDLMWQFLQMGHQKANITALKENCDLLRQAMIQKNAGQRGDNRNYVSFDDLGTIINCIVIEAMCLYLSGKLDQIEEMSDLIDRQRALSICDSAIDLWTGQIGEGALIAVKNSIAKLPSAEPKQRYTEEELSVFAHGISLSLLSKRSAQHWRYDEDTATEIEFLERLYDKVSADMKGGQG